jgi:hypothetical protein
MPSFDTEQVISDNNWHNLSLSVNKALDQVIIYLDNVVVKEVTLSSLDSANTSSVTISFDYNGETQSIELAKLDNQWQLSQSSGTHSLEIDQFTVTNTALSQRQIEDDLATFPVVELTPSANSITQDSAFNGSVTENNIVKTEDKMTFDSATNSSIVVTSDKFTNYKLNQFTVSSWINPETQNVDMGVMSALLSNSHMMQLLLNAEHKLVFQATLSAIQQTAINLQESSLSLTGNVADGSVNVSTLLYFNEQPETTVRSDLENTPNAEYIVTSLPTNNAFSHSITKVSHLGTNYDYTSLPEIHAYTLSSIVTTAMVPKTIVDNVKHDVITLDQSGYTITLDSPSVDETGLTLSYTLAAAKVVQKQYVGVFATDFVETSIDTDLLALLVANTFPDATLAITTPVNSGIIVSTPLFVNAINSTVSESTIVDSNGYIVKVFIMNDNDEILKSNSINIIAKSTASIYVELPLQYEYRSEDGILSNPPQTISNTLHTSINGQTMGEPIYFVKDSLANFGTGTNYYPNGTDKPFVIVTDDVAGTSIANLQVTLDAPGTYLYTADLCITTPSTGTAYYNQIEGWLESSSDNGTTWNEILGTYSTIQLGRNHSPRYFRFVRMIEMTASSSLWIRPVLRTHLINSGSSKANTGAIGSPQRTILTHARVSTRAIDTSLPYVNVKSRGNSTALRGKSPVYHADVNAYPYKRQVRNSANVWVDSHQELDLSPIDGMNHYDDLGNITSSLIRYTNTTGPPTFTIEAAGDATPGSPQRVTFKQGGKYLVHLNMHVTVAGPYDSIVDHLNSQYIIQVYLFNPSGNGGQGTYTSIMMDLDRMSKYDGSGTADDCTNQHSYDVLIDIPEGDTNCQLIVYANVDHWYWSERTQYFAITLLEYNITMLPSVGYTQLQGKSGMTVFNGNADDDLITPTGAEYGTSLAVSISNYDENNLEFVGTTINNGDMSIDVGTPSNINVLNAGNYNIKLHGILDLKTTATAASQELISKYGGVVLTLVVYNNDGSVKSDNVRELMSNMYPSTKNEKYKRTYTNKTTAPAISLVQQAYALHVMINFEVQDIVLEAGEYIRFHVSMFRNNPWNKVTTVTMVSNDFSEDTSSLIIKKQ